MTRHGVNYRRLNGQRTDLLRNLLVKAIPIDRLIIKRVKRLDGQTWQSLPDWFDGRMNECAKVDRLSLSGGLGEQRVRLQGEIVIAAGTKAKDSDCCRCRLTSSSLFSYMYVV